MQAGLVHGDGNHFLAVCEAVLLYHHDLLQDEVVKGNDEAVHFHGGQEFLRGQEAHFLALPADQGFCAHDLAGHDVVLGLIPDIEFPVGKGLHHAFFDMLLKMQVLVHFLVVELHYIHGAHDAAAGHVGLFLGHEQLGAGLQLA